jgi:Ca-activated chloride channel family protein
MSISPSEEPTAFFDTVIYAVQYLDKSADTGSRRVMVVISDGEENYSKSGTLQESLRELQRTDCLFYSINPTGAGIKLNAVSLKGQSVMEAMASQTGGKAFNVIKTEELESAFRQIADELQAQYLFGYYADERAGEGFRRITVHAPRRPDLRIRARQGYYSRKTAS